MRDFLFSSASSVPLCFKILVLAASKIERGIYGNAGTSRIEGNGGNECGAAGKGNSGDPGAGRAQILRAG
jgi:hypothetical protein